MASKVAASSPSSPPWTRSAISVRSPWARRREASRRVPTGARMERLATALAARKARSHTRPMKARFRRMARLAPASTASRGMPPRMIR